MERVLDSHGEQGLDGDGDGEGRATPRGGTSRATGLPRLTAMGGVAAGSWGRGPRGSTLGTGKWGTRWRRPWGVLAEAPGVGTGSAPKNLGRSAPLGKKK